MFTSYAVKDPMRSKNDIKIVDIDKELHKLWESLEATNKIRACLFTLVLYTDDGDRTQHFKDLVTEIIETLPCRIIFIRANHREDENYLRTGVSALTSGHGDQMVACDQITIDAAGEHLKRVPFVVTPHLVPDLPVYVIWGQDPNIDADILPQLEKYATRVIFDSECSDNLHLFARTVARHLESVNCEVADLNWARAKGWRDVLTQVFHNRDRVTQLANSKKINIHYNARKCEKCRHPEVQALYLQGWLAGRLGWKFEGFESSEGNARISYHNTMADTIIHLHPEYVEKLPAGSIMKVEIDSHHEHTFVMKRENLTRIVRCHVSSPEHCELPYSLLLSSLHRGQQLMKEIFYEPSSGHYQSMLKIIAETDLGRSSS